MSYYKKIGKILPKNILNAFKREFEFMDFRGDEEIFVGFLTIFSLILGFILTINLFLLFELSLPFFLLSFIILSIIIFALPYYWMDLSAESNGKFVENILPDALQLIASHIKSGLTTERALLIASRPEFGALERELKKATQKILAGERIETALLELPNQIKSKILERTVWLISKGVSSGGQIADLLVQLSNDLRQQRSVQSEIKSNISMYVLLIFFGSAFGGPFLLGISTFIVQALTAQTAGIGEGINPEALSKSPVPIVTGSGGGIDPEFVLFFAYLVLFVGSIFASMTIGVINSGKEKTGLKYFIPILIVSLTVFIVVRELFLFFFAGLLT